MYRVCCGSIYAICSISSLSTPNSCPTSARISLISLDNWPVTRTRQVRVSKTNRRTTISWTLTVRIQQRTVFIRSQQQSFLVLVISVNACQQPVPRMINAGQHITQWVFKFHRRRHNWTHVRRRMQQRAQRLDLPVRRWLIRAESCCRSTAVYRRR